ncbi:MAG: hypothetical protein LBU38_03975, partial [Propionibacteriaceae bacterium]|nr:hypothetical protein [Propionibacteriaceae bacterium]
MGYLNIKSSRGHNRYRVTAVTVIGVLVCMLLPGCSQVPEQILIAIIDGDVNSDLPVFAGYTIDRQNEGTPDAHGTGMASLVLGLTKGDPLPSQRVRLLSYDIVAGDTNGRDVMAAAISK